MRTSWSLSIAAGAVLALGAGAASAATDYYLKIDGIDGETSAPESIEVESFSWGTSNAGIASVSSGSSTRAAAPAASRSSPVAPREPASGQTSGRRSAEPVAPGSTAPVVVAPVAGAMATFSVALRESPTRASTGSALARACASGRHIKSATLTVSGREYVLSDVVVSACAVSGERRTAEFRGHVTLIR